MTVHMAACVGSEPGLGRFGLVQLSSYITSSRNREQNLLVHSWKTAVCLSAVKRFVCGALRGTTSNLKVHRKTVGMTEGQTGSTISDVHITDGGQ